MRRRGDRARDAGDSEVNAQTIELRVRDAGRHFAIQKALFLIDDDIMNTQEDKDFDIDQEFASTNNERQGQLRDILSVLPDDVQPKINQPWVQDSFLDGVHSQRASISHRLRVEALPVIVPDVKPFATSASRFTAFSEFIGYKPPTETSEAFYDRFEVPILYDHWDGKIDLDHLFRGNRLLEVFVSVIRGPRGAQGLFEGKSKLPQAKCLERIHKIVRITPGAIASAAILALRNKKAWAIRLLDYWNRILFPNADKPGDHGAVGIEKLDDGEELEDIFAQAPSVEPQGNADNEEDQHRTTP
ncbi:hypothetical protein C8R44DRAFT_749104 [Mycena epipterygia]|nr:hypothetical protein C8R44DRAFT_749104 [Mycena epipterygia]